jgi:hypothetical protein
MSLVVEAPNGYEVSSDVVSVFLGGTIDGGRAPDWQRRLVEAVDGVELLLEDHAPPIRVLWLNPRRSVWDDSIAAREQVIWEYRAQVSVDVRVYWFEPGHLSPVTLSEVAAFGQGAIVGCDPSYAYYANVEMYMAHNGTLVHTWDEFVDALKAEVGRIRAARAVQVEMPAPPSPSTETPSSESEDADEQEHNQDWRVWAALACALT